MFAPFLAPHDPNFQFRGEGLTRRGSARPVRQIPGLGTDKFGRDELSRLLFGARTSLTVGIVANALAIFIGVIVGTVAAYSRGRRLHLSVRGHGTHVPIPLETILMRTTDIVLAFPALLVAIALVAIVGPSLNLVIVVIAAILWTATARIVYSTSLVVLASDFVVAATAIGVSDRRMIVRHLLPHLVPLIIVYATLGIAAAILFEATLSFLGVGVPAPAASWGGMIIEHVGYYRTDPRVVALPGLAIMASSSLRSISSAMPLPTLWTLVTGAEMRGRRPPTEEGRLLVGIDPRSQTIRRARRCHHAGRRRLRDAELTGAIGPVVAERVERTRRHRGRRRARHVDRGKHPRRASRRVAPFRSGRTVRSSSSTPPRATTSRRGRPNG